MVNNAYNSLTTFKDANSQKLTGTLKVQGRKGYRVLISIE